MFALASTKTYKEGQIIFEEGSQGEWVYVIISGSVEISKNVKGKQIVVELLQQNEVFGELSFLGGMKRTATAMAVAVTTLGFIDKNFMDQEFNKLAPDFKSVLIAVFERFKKMIDLACEYSSRTTPRIPKTLAVTYEDENTTIKAYASDISEGGLFVGTESPFNLGRKFPLTLQIPGLIKPIEIMSQVAWVKKRPGKDKTGHSGMGVKFFEMDVQNRDILGQYLKTMREIGLKSFQLSEKDDKILKQYLNTIEKPDYLNNGPPVCL